MGKQAYSREAYRSGQHALTSEEVELVLQHARSWSEHALMVLAVTTGMRRGDIVRLKWGDLDLESGLIRYYEQKKRRTRTVYIGGDVVSMLRKLSTTVRGPYVFNGRSEPLYGHGHLSDRAAYDVFNRCLQSAGLRPRPFHALRATCIKLCQAKGWSMAQTAEHVGDTVRVIEQHYLAPSDSEMRAVAREKPIYGG